jgi:hypothetical protein
MVVFPMAVRNFFLLESEKMSVHGCFSYCCQEIFPIALRKMSFVCEDKGEKKYFFYEVLSYKKFFSRRQPPEILHKKVSFIK